MPRAALLAALAAFCSVQADQPLAGPLPTYEATYRVEYKGTYAGDALFNMRYDSERERYIFESRTRARGIAKLIQPRPVIERSEFQYRDGHILPLLYTFNDGSRKGKRSTQVIFNWQEGIATSIYKGITAKLEVEPGTLDRLAMQTAVMEDMGRPDGPSEYLLVHRNIVKRYRYEELETATIDTVLGSLLTKVYLQTRVGSSRRLKVWVVPYLKYMAVRMEQQRNGKTETVLTLHDLTFQDS